MQFSDPHEHHRCVDVAHFFCVVASVVADFCFSLAVLGDSHAGHATGLMLRFVGARLAYGPRNMPTTPPPLVRRGGHFECRHCESAWTSQMVWVIESSQKPYQGQSCTKCGTTNRPKSIFWLGEKAPPREQADLLRKRAKYEKMRRSR